MIPSIERLRKYVDCTRSTAKEIQRIIVDKRARGAAGLDFFDDRVILEYHNIYAAVNDWVAEKYHNLLIEETADMFLDAWLEGIQRRDRVTIDATTVCDDYLLLCVKDKFAAIWALDDPYFAHRTTVVIPTTVQRLRDEGYKLRIRYDRHTL